MAKRRRYRHWLCDLEGVPSNFAIRSHGYTIHGRYRNESYAAFFRECAEKYMDRFRISEGKFRVSRKTIEFQPIIGPLFCVLSLMFAQRDDFKGYCINFLTIRAIRNTTGFGRSKNNNMFAVLAGGLLSVFDITGKNQDEIDCLYRLAIAMVDTHIGSDNISSSHYGDESSWPRAEDVAQRPTPRPVIVYDDAYRAQAKKRQDERRQQTRRENAIKKGMTQIEARGDGGKAEKKWLPLAAKIRQERLEQLKARRNVRT